MGPATEQTMVQSAVPTPVFPRNEDEARSKAYHRELRNQRLAFPPLYVIVGVYRLCTDKQLYVPVWDKCKHGFVRGLCVGAVWASKFVYPLHEPD
jgi:hypothetical protein